MKAVLIIILFSITGYVEAQTKRHDAKVSFAKEGNDWIATVINKDTVTVIYKIMFEETPKIVIEDAIYKIDYTGNSISFEDEKKKKSYTFSVENKEVLEEKSTNYYWHVIGIARIEPVCFPKK